MISLKEESSTVQSLKDEFTQRIAEAEGKAQLACKERDIAKKVYMFIVMNLLFLKLQYYFALKCIVFIGHRKWRALEKNWRAGWIQMRLWNW